MSDLAEAAEKYRPKTAQSGDGTTQNQHMRAEGDGQSHSDQLKQARDNSGHKPTDNTPEGQAKATVEHLKKGPQDAQHIIDAVNKIQPDSQREQVLDEMRHQSNEQDNLKK